MATPTDTPSIDTPRMQLATVLEILITGGWSLRPPALAVAMVYGITSSDRAIYEHPVKAV
jgi:hypothetical protein